MVRFAMTDWITIVETVEDTITRLFAMTKNRIDALPGYNVNLPRNAL